MPEQKFDPVKEFISLRDNISKSIRGVTRPNEFPAVDIYETDEAVIVYTEPMIGVNSSSIEVSVEREVLTISGTSIPPFDVPDSALLHRELRFGAFSREIHIPRRVSSSEASASFKKGILTITLPKQSAKVKGHIIDITPTE